MEINSNSNYFADAFSRTSKMSQIQADRNYVSESKIRQWIREHLVDSGPYEKEAIVEKLLPVFRKLNNDSPEGLKLIMSKSPQDFEIKICESNSVFFSENTMGSANIPGARTYTNPNDRTTIELYCDSDLYKNNFKWIVNHELNHAISFLAVKDFEGPPQGLSTRGMISETLSRIGENYNMRAQSAQMELQENRSPFLEAGEKTRNTIKILRKYKILWGYVLHKDKELNEYKFGLPTINHPDEVLAYGLQAYFGKKRKEILREEEPELCRLIEEVIIPKIKERAREIE